MDATIKNEKIMDLYNQIAKGGKIKVMRTLSLRIGKSVNVMKSHWFPNHQIPEIHQDEVIEVLQSAVSQQNIEA